VDPPTAAVVVLAAQCAVDQMEVLVPSEEGGFVAHPDSSYYVILNQAAQRVPGCGDQILVVGIGYHLRFGSGHLVFCALLAELISQRETYGESECSSHLRQSRRYMSC